MVTMRDVAKASGVSVATVSRVLNESLSVNIETRKKVQDTIKNMDYQPNLLARNLRRLETKMIVVLIPNISNPFYSKIVKGIEDVAHKYGFNVMLCNTDLDSKRESFYLELVKNRLSDGVILMSPMISKEDLLELSKNFPIVQCCDYKEGVEISHVSIDNFSAAYNAVTHLIKLGHKRIGLITFSEGSISINQRIEGYKRCINDAAIDYDESLIKYCEGNLFDNGFNVMKEFLAMGDRRPTAVFAVSDIIAIGAIKAIKQEGLLIPQELAVIGFDDISFATMTEPPLSTVAQPVYQLGCTAMELLIKKIKEEQKDPENIILDYQLIVRGSTVKENDL